MLIEALSSPFFPLLTFLLGLLVGHRFALFRDIRKELNELVTPVRAELASEASDPSPFRLAVSRHVADTIAARLNFYRRRQFLQACDCYWQSKKQQHQDNAGQPFHTNPDAIRNTAHQLLKTIPIR